MSSQHRFQLRPLSSVPLLASVVILSLGGCQSAPQPPQMGAIPVKVTAVQTGTLAETSDFNASLQSRQSIQLRPQVSGRIAQILVRSGQQVSAGTPLIQIDPAQQSAAVSSNLAAIQAAQADIETAKATLKSLQAQRLSDQASVKFARADAERYATLVKAGAVSVQQAQSINLNYETAQARLRATEEQIRAQQATINQRQKALLEARANTQQQAVVLQYYRVTAPFAGMIGDIPPKVGDYVTTDSGLLTLTQNQPLEVYIYVPVERLADIRKGMPVQLLDSQGKVIGNSSIFFVSPQTTNTTQTTLVKALYDNSQGRLRADQQIQARVIWQQRPGILVPTTAVTNLAGQNFVFVAEAGKDNRAGTVARQKPVELGRIQGNSYQVLKGLEPGENIITSGIQMLSDGAPIKPGS